MILPSCFKTLSHCRANVIWPQNCSREEDLYALFRKTFSHNGRSCKVRLFANTYYNLYIDGSFLHRGPVRRHEMHAEFDIDYAIKLSERFAYTYYGCCEPLDKKLSVISKIKNLRKIGVSPWANEEAMAEWIGGSYVYSRKPNPANVAISTDPEVIRRETEKTVKLCIKHGCPYDITLKDISTVSHRPENLIIWASTVSAVLDKYYGE